MKLCRRIAAAPYVIPAGGALLPHQKVEIKTITPDALILFTLDGTEPSENSGEFSSISYNENSQHDNTHHQSIC